MCLGRTDGLIQRKRAFVSTTLFGWSTALMTRPIIHIRHTLGNPLTRRLAPSPLHRHCSTQRKTMGSGQICTTRTSTPSNTQWPRCCRARRNRHPPRGSSHCRRTRSSEKCSRQGRRADSVVTIDFVGYMKTYGHLSLYILLRKLSIDKSAYSSSGGRSSRLQTLARDMLIVLTPRESCWQKRVRSRPFSACRRSP